MQFALILVAVLLQCHLGVVLGTYTTYTMTHPATSAGVYSTGTVNTYQSGATTYYPQGAVVTYPTASTVYYPTYTTVNTGSGGGSYTYNPGSYVNYPAGAQVSYQPGSTCFYPRTTSCSYGSYNGGSSVAVRYPAQTPVSCYSSSTPTYYSPGTYSSGTTYYNYDKTGGSYNLNNADGTQSTVTNCGYTQNNYPISYVVNQNTGKTSCVTQTGSSSYLTYNTATGSTSTSSSIYG